MAAKKKTKTEQPVELEPVVESAPPPAEPEADLDSHSEVISPAQAARLFGERRPVNRPDISRLPDAFVGGEPQFRRGDRIVIERYASFLAGCPYLDTKTYRVTSVDPITGRLDLYDDSFLQYACDNWKYGLRIGQVYKLANGATVTTRRKRGRPRKNPIEAPKAPELGADGRPVKKRRGRPKGSKNRPKEEIREEKVVKAAKRVAKKRAKRTR